MVIIFFQIIITTQTRSRRKIYTSPILLARVFSNWRWNNNADNNNGNDDDDNNNIDDDYDKW